LPKRRTISRQNAEQIVAKTPNDFLPKRRTIFCQSAEKLLQKPKIKDIIYLSELYLRGGLYEGI
jgi:7-cyano-7-deazaguanine synthase in queuosine biosynthesis